MKLYIGADHAGFEMKEVLKNYLSEAGYTVEDKGTYSLDSVDYPDYAHAVATAVEADNDSLGILLCGSANGVCIPEIASLARQHNDANIVGIPARYVSNEMGIEILKNFLSATFEGGRHQKRVEKISC
jgi:ribose 5-phosphate isomerase B